MSHGINEKRGGGGENSKTVETLCGIMYLLSAYCDLAGLLHSPEMQS